MLFKSSKEIYSASPFSIFFFLSWRMSLCHSGDSISSLLHNESHNFSIACKRSIVDIFSISDKIIITSLFIGNVENHALWAWSEFKHFARVNGGLLSAYRFVNLLGILPC